MVGLPTGEPVGLIDGGGVDSAVGAALSSAIASTGFSVEGLELPIDGIEDGSSETRTVGTGVTAESVGDSVATLCSLTGMIELAVGLRVGAAINPKNVTSVR